MKVRIIYTVDVDDGYRAAVRHYYHARGLATRADLLNWFESHGASLDDELRRSHAECCWHLSPTDEPQYARRR